MKKLSFILTVFSLILLSKNLYAQEPSNYFIGKWQILTKGTPSGDQKSIVRLERLDGKLAGEMTYIIENQSFKFAKVEEKESSVTVYFTANGYDVNVMLVKKDQNHVDGNMMDMFPVTGERVIENPAK